jgi:cytochrome c biogenesis protein CcmG/thiol:disulfide interchange protein DsbE
MVAGLSAAGSAASLLKEADRQHAPSFELQDAQGHTVRMSDLDGRVVVINFWATWCVPCKEEIPWLVDFENRYKDQGFTVVGVSLDEKGWDVVKPYAEKMGMNYPIVIGDARTAYKYGQVKSLPVTFVVDRDRRVAAIHFGLINKKKVDQEIRDLLQQPRIQPSAQ